ncbi:MAG: hypothetical protein A2Y17_07115 [Clostridiales bacterium GWF2_38_85]|nr:MAG: hypothetical protein A2Y17_07115 [Clostridiales bacterium GWF2_38_85]
MIARELKMSESTVKRALGDLLKAGYIKKEPTINLNIVNFGIIPYSIALEIQYKLLEKRQNGEIDNTLLLLEHPPVLTLGTRGEYKNIYLPSDEFKKAGNRGFRS